MILIADSGSTKTDRTLLLSSSEENTNKVIATFKTQGITPIHQTAADIRQILGQELMSQLSTFPRAHLVSMGVLDTSLVQHASVCFYGSGCTPAHVPMMKQVLNEVLSPKDFEVHSDLMAAARALCGHDAGIACILGTGANSCLYDGEQIVQNTPALGYILGDEGSGSVLGRLFLNAIFKNPKMANLRDKFLEETKQTQADIIKKVYNEPMANRYLASTSTFIIEHPDNPTLHQLVIDNFRQFFRSNIDPYNRKDLPVHFVGSMAFHYRSQLEEAAKLEGYTIGQTLQSPMEGLIKYHS
jgi:N-acetylglucosamine kinase-like BadF-type ATPase